MNVPFRDSPADRWEYEGRFYTVTAFSDVSARDGYGWELEDLGPAPGRGVVLVAFSDDTTGACTLRVFTDQPLPFALVQRFIGEAAQAFSLDA
ncbi:hypothetical protein [Nocardia sp. NPDC057668]|uniref:hypothetical protein n=1 Tax=Nocardia sp. NPDC057668 TaxID=3346202 RepID=UPI0036700DD6